MDKPWILSIVGEKALWKHAIFWLGYYLIFSLVMSFYGGLVLYLKINILNVFLYILVYYPLRYWMINNIFKKGRKGLFLISLLGFMLVIYLTYWGIRFAFYEGVMEHPPNKPFLYTGEFLIRILRYFSPAALLLVWEYQHTRKQHAQRIRLLEKEKLSTELKFLKAQINPHFLFNTLNNLYSFVVTESPKAPDLITRLTGILDYVLNKSQSREVPLLAELNTIEHYLELEKIRYGERLEVSYRTYGIDNKVISPLILLSIIENAFKHGASGDIEQPKVHIDIKADAEKIKCTVWNTKSRHQGEINDAYKKGIGLSNIKRQLNLIYPNRHELNIDDQDQSFELSLTINTAA